MGINGVGLSKTRKIRLMAVVPARLDATQLRCKHHHGPWFSYIPAHERGKESQVSCQANLYVCIHVCIYVCRHTHRLPNVLNLSEGMYVYVCVCMYVCNCQAEPPSTCMYVGIHVWFRAVKIMYKKKRKYTRDGKTHLKHLLLPT